MITIIYFLVKGHVGYIMENQSGKVIDERWKDETKTGLEATIFVICVLK